MKTFFNSSGGACAAGGNGSLHPTFRKRSARSDGPYLLCLCLLFATALQTEAQRFVKYVDSVQALKDLNVGDVHASVFVRGYYAANDGGGGFFVWNSSDTTATNRGTILKGKTTGAELATGRWNRVYKFQGGELNVRWFGAKGDGVTDDTTAVTATLNEVPDGNGGRVGAYDGKFRFNLVCLKSGVELMGNSHTLANSFGTTFTNCWIPADTTKPVIQVGTNTGYIRGVVIRNATFEGSAGGDVAVRYFGGTEECKIIDCAIAYFKTNLIVQAGSVYPASTVRVIDVDGVCHATADNVRGIYLGQAATYPTSYTTHVRIVGGHWYGAGLTGTNSYVLENDSVEADGDGFYFDVYHGHGMKLTSSIQSPIMNLKDCRLDSGNATNVVIEGYDNARNYAGLITENFQVAGLWKELDGQLMTVPRTILRRDSMARGIFRLRHTSAGSGQSILYFEDGINGRTNRIQNLNGLMSLIPNAGGGTILADTNGAVIFEVIGAPGSTPLFNTLNPNTVPYIDGNKFAQSSAVTPTELGYLSGATSGLQGQLALKVDTLNGVATNRTERGTMTNNAVREEFVQTATASGGGITLSWTNNPATYRYTLNADTTITLANATGTNRTLVLYAYPDGTHKFTWPSGIVPLISSGNTNQPFTNGLVVIYFDRLDNTNYVSVSPDMSGGAAAGVSDTAFASSWDTVTGTAPSKNAVYDWAHTFDTDDDGLPNKLDQGAGIANTDSSGVLQTPITTSAGLYGVLGDETGSGSGTPLAVFNQSPVIVTPTIASFVNANHNHSSSATGGLIATNTVQEKVWVAIGSTNIGVFDRITLWPGSNISISNTNGAGNTNIDITITGTGGGGGSNALLDGSSHTDTLAGTVARGDLIIGNSTPKWARVALKRAGSNFTSDGTDANWRAPMDDYQWYEDFRPRRSSVSNPLPVDWSSDTVGTPTGAGISVVSPTWPEMGAIHLTSGTAVDTGQEIRAGDSGSPSWVTLAPLQANANWILIFRVKISSTANVALRAGVRTGTSSATVEHAAWMGVRYDTGGGLGDSNFMLVTRNASTYGLQQATIAADTSYHDIMIRSTTAGTVLMSVDYGTEYPASSNVPVGALLPFFDSVTRVAATAKDADVDFIGFYAWGLNR
jgi:hypothetical protein